MNTGIDEQHDEFQKYYALRAFHLRSASLNEWPSASMSASLKEWPSALKSTTLKERPSASMSAALEKWPIGLEESFALVLALRPLRVTFLKRSAHQVKRSSSAALYFSALTTSTATSFICILGS
jgi:hypothetical protein